VSTDTHAHDAPPASSSTWRDRWIGAAVATASALWIAAGIDLGTNHAGGHIVALFAAASASSTIIAVWLIANASRRATIGALGQLAGEVEQLGQKFEAREAAWDAISKLTDRALDDGTVVPLWGQKQ
jgi:hypothetical protein